MEKLKLGTFFINFMGCYILLMGILMIFVTEIMFISDFGWYTGIEYSVFYSNPSTRIFAEIFILQKKVMGFILGSVGVLVLFIAKMNYSKGDKWAWYFILIAGALVWGTFIGYKILIGYYGGSMITFIVGAALLVVGLLIPFKDFFKKE